jgi:hypothetical protein
MKTSIRLISHWRHVALTIVAVILTVGCKTPAKNTDDLAEVEPAPIVNTTIQKDDDAVVALYNEPDSADLAPTTNSRTKASSAIVPSPESVQIDAPIELSGKEPTTEKPADLVTADDQPRRTSMPTRDQKKGKPTRGGGVRKAVAVDLAASELFGKWKIDQEKSSKDFLRADAVLFLADGRMRIWREKSIEDGRWTWNENDGLKTGGLEGVPFSLGAFELMDGTIVITSNDDKIVVLIPDRIFIAPPSIVTPPKSSDKVQQKSP